MSIAAILAPVFVLVLLTFGLMVWMGLSRGGALKRREAKIADVALGQPNWPPKVQQISNNYINQFQVPVLFYVLVVLAIVTHHADFVFVIMSWLFVLMRLVHSYVHTTSNYVRHRFNAFLIGCLILLAMWIIFAVRIMLGIP